MIGVASTFITAAWNAMKLQKVPDVHHLGQFKFTKLGFLCSNSTTSLPKRVIPRHNLLGFDVFQQQRVTTE